MLYKKKKIISSICYKYLLHTPSKVNKTNPWVAGGHVSVMLQPGGCTSLFLCIGQDYKLLHCHRCMVSVIDTIFRCHRETVCNGSSRMTLGVPKPVVVVSSVFFFSFHTTFLKKEIMLLILNKTVCVCHSIPCLWIEHMAMKNQVQLPFFDFWFLHQSFWEKQN